jgi:hypothetical protein
MAQVLVRNLDEQIVAALRRKAELHRRLLARLAATPWARPALALTATTTPG